MNYQDFYQQNKNNFSESFEEIKQDFKNVVGDKVNVVCSSEPLAGKFGYMVWTLDEDGNELSCSLERNMWGEVKEVLIKTGEEFEQIFQDNYSKDYKIYIHDNIKNRLIGFIVLKNSSAIWYHIPLSFYKEYQLNLKDNKKLNQNIL